MDGVDIATRPVGYATDRHLREHIRPKGVQVSIWDRTSEGAQWRTWEHLADTERSAWFGYAGGWGEVHTDTRCE